MIASIQAVLGRQVSVLKVDPGLKIVALEKPCGIMTHPNTPKDIDKSLLKVSYDAHNECYYWEGNILYVLHRLDSPTSGVIVCTWDRHVATKVRLLFEQRSVKKIYYALVKGNVKNTQKLWIDRMQVTHTKGKMRVNKGGMHIAKTTTSIQSAKEDSSLLMLMPLTGFTHQLRVQCAWRHHPIVGDKTYGDFSFNRLFLKANDQEDRLYLHASQISIDFGKSQVFTAKSILPKGFLV
jgi:tRNA pseudouridine65 synthase